MKIHKISLIHHQEGDEVGEQLIHYDSDDDMATFCGIGLQAPQMKAARVHGAAQEASTAIVNCDACLRRLAYANTILRTERL